MLNRSPLLLIILLVLAGGIACSRSKVSVVKSGGALPTGDAKTPVVVDHQLVLRDLNSAVPDTAVKAMNLLGRISLVDPAEISRARIALLRAVRNRRRNQAVRIAAVQALAEMHDSASLPVLVYQLEHEAQPQMRRALESSIAILVQKSDASSSEKKGNAEKKTVQTK